MADVEEIAGSVETLRARMVDLVVRGLASVGPSDLSTLHVLTEQCEKNGMAHIASRLRSMLRAVASDTKGAPSLLLSAYTSLHVFERVLSLEVATEAWRVALASEEDDDDDKPTLEPIVVAETKAGAIPPGEEKKLLALLDELAKAIEDLVRTGLTSATEATRQKLDVSFKEASRMKLLRLGASLRYVNEEVGRFLAHSDAFASKRFVFFAHRAWLLAKGIGEGLREKNDRVLEKLLMTGSKEPAVVKSIEVVTLGVLSRTMQNACTFDFRLRVTKADDQSWVGRSLVLGLVFGRKSTEIAAEAFLHLPQPQKYHPKVFTEAPALTVTASAILWDDRGGGRLMLGPKATVTQGKALKTWEPFRAFTLAPLLDHVKGHVPSPLDLAVELQEEVLLEDWTCEAATGRENVFFVHWRGLVLDAIVTPGVLQAHFEGFAKSKKPNPPLFGLVHYELGRLVLTPLSVVDDDDGPKHLMLTNEKINLTALLGSLQL